MKYEEKYVVEGENEEGRRICYQNDKMQGSKDTYAILSPRNCRDVRMHNITEMIQLGLPSGVYATCTAVHIAALCTCKS